MEKGILTKAQEKKFAEAIDKAINAKGIVELLDGYVARAVISLIDDQGVEKLNLKPELKVKLSELADAAIAEDIESAQLIAADIINQLVDIPGLEEDAESVLIEGVVKFVVGAVIVAIRKKKK